MGSSFQGREDSGTIIIFLVRQMTGNVRRDNEKVKGEEPLKKQLEEVHLIICILRTTVELSCYLR